MPKTPIDLLPGDHLLYGKHDFFGAVTAVKTWSPAVHVEVYRGNDVSVASRNGVGVNQYPLRPEQLIAVLRPSAPLDMERAMAWFFKEAQGQGYDWKGLLCFTLAVKEGAKDKMFCSEFATRFGRAGGFHAFNFGFDADRISPGQFPQSPAFDWVWVREGTNL